MHHNQVQAEARRFLSRAIRTLMVMPDPDAAIYAQGTYWPETNPENWREWQEIAQEKSENQRPRFQPTTFDVDHYLDVLQWLRDRDEKSVQAFWAYELSDRITWHMIGRRLNLSERQVRRNVDALLWGIAFDYRERIIELIDLRQSYEKAKTQQRSA